MIDDRDIEYLEKIFDGRYRKIDDCEEITQEEQKIDNAIKKDLSDIKLLQVRYNTKFDIMLGIVSGIGALVLPMVLKYLFGG